MGSLVLLIKFKHLLKVFEEALNKMILRRLVLLQIFPDGH
jgi:hypothetical protein